MNRTMVFGIALFCAILGIAVLGNNTEATAGHGCDGGCAASSSCSGGCGGWLKNHRRCHGFRLFSRLGSCHSSCSGEDCSGEEDCSASKCDGGCHASRCHGGLFSRLRALRCNGCAGDSCCGTEEDHGCSGDDHHEEAAPEVPDAPAEGSASTKNGSKVVYRSVAYRR